MSIIRVAKRKPFPRLSGGYAFLSHEAQKERKVTEHGDWQESTSPVRSTNVWKAPGLTVGMRDKGLFFNYDKPRSSHDYRIKSTIIYFLSFRK